MPMQLERWITFLQVDTNTLVNLCDFVSEIEPHFDGILDTSIHGSKKARLLPHSSRRQHQWTVPVRRRGFIG